MKPMNRLALSLLLAVTSAFAQKTPIQITADLTEAPRKLYHAEIDIPVAPGQTIRKPFPRVGAFVYQGGLSCSISRSNTIRVRVE